MSVSDEHSAYKTYGKHRSLRLSGHDYRESRAYHITWGTHERQKLLDLTGLASEVCRILQAEAVHTHTDLFAFCVMPDHVHILLRPNGSDPIQYVQTVKGKTTRAYWKLGGVGKLWQRGFYDHILRSEESLFRIAQYILVNPVRAGLTDVLGAYPFCGSTVFKIEEL